MKKATEKKNGNGAAGKASSKPEQKTSPTTTNHKPEEKKKASTTREKDKFGLAIGSKRSKAMALLATGKYTVAEAVAKIDGYGLSKTLRALEGRVFKVTKDADGKVKITTTTGK
jgi:hypothetical protein